MKKLLTISWMVLLAPIALFAQNSAYSDLVLSAQGRPIAGAQVSVCNTPGLATTAASVTSNIVVLTFGSSPITAGFVAGMTLQVSGFTGGDVFFNGGTLSGGVITGGFTILSVTSTTVSYALTHANASAISNGNAFQQGNSVNSCAPLASISSDVAGANPITQPGLTTDGLGNYAFFAAGNSYIVQLSGTGITLKLKPVNLACSGSVNCTFSGTTIISGPLTVSNTATFTGALNASGTDTFSGPMLLTNSPCGASAVSVQSLINALPTANSGGDSGGGVVSLPCGTYTINAGLTVQNHGVHIRGDGFGTVILAGASMTGTDMLKVFAGGSYVFVRDFSLEDLVMDCNGVAGVRGLHIQDLQDRGLIRNVTFRNCDGNEIFTDVLNTTINSHITFDNVITYPFRVKGTPVSWNIHDTEYLEIKHSKAYGNNGSGGRNTGPGINLQGVNRSYIDSATAVSLWVTGYQVTNGLAQSDSVTFDSPSCESVLTTGVNITGGGAGTASTRWKIFSINVPSPAPTTLLNCDFCTQGIFIGRDDAAITLTANAANNYIFVDHVGAALPTDAGTNNQIQSVNNGNLQLISNSGGGIILQPGGAATAAGGTIRLPKTADIRWLNNAGNADIFVTHNASDQLNITAGNGWAGILTAPLLAGTAGGVDVGSTALPYGNLWLGTAATNNFKFQPAATAAARVVSIADPTVATSLPLFGGIGAGHIQTKRVSGCATGAAQFNTCDTTVTWTTAFADANYTATCTGDVVTSGVPQIEGINISAAKIGASITVRTIALTAVAAQFTTIDCTAQHD